MKHIIILLLLSSQVSAQSIVCTRYKKGPEVYIPGYPFHFEITDLDDCSNFVYESDNGLIRPGSDCHFELSFRRTGTFLIEVTGKNGNVVLSKEGVVRNYPIPDVKFAKKKNGTVRSGEFRVQKGIYAEISIADMSGNHPITSFQYTIHRRSEVLYSGSQNNGRFGALIRSQIKAMRPGDSIYCYEIKTILPGDIFETTLNTISITMK